jgi:hypothetical protein
MQFLINLFRRPIFVVRTPADVQLNEEQYNRLKAQIDAVWPYKNNRPLLLEAGAYLERI